MKNLIFLLLLASFTSNAQWIDLFNGKDLDNWKISENPSSFRIENGELIVNGNRGHLFYNGYTPKNFEVHARVKTYPGANSGLYVCTKFLVNDWPKQGYEIQVNNSHTDWRRTASVYGIVDTKETYVKDEEWFDLNVTVQGNHITTKINGKTVIDYTEPIERANGSDPRKLQAGTIAIQAHDPKSKVAYQAIQIREL
jgi:Domain of Unknown Function (DUF1080)